MLSAASRRRQPMLAILICAWAILMMPINATLL
jgi:hypothetical protein